VVWERGKAILGFAIAQFRGSAALLITIDVLAAERRGGIGGALLESVEATMRGLGARNLSLEVHDKNHPALRFYEKAGFAPTALLPDYYGPGLDALRMKKRL
jgi:ribosomal-protein-alanine N-acetyltransferase